MLNREILDEVIPVDDEDAIETARQLARSEGVLAGISAGAAVWAALEGGAPARVARRPDRDDPPRLGRALRLDAVLRAVGHASPSRADRAKRLGTLSPMSRHGLIRRTAAEIRRDVAAAHSRDPAARGVGSAEILATWPGVHAMLAHRVAHALHTAGVPVLPRVIAAFARAVTGIEIHPAA